MKTAGTMKHWIIPLVAVAFLGCAHIGQENDEKESRDRLIQRVNQYWDARIKNEVEVAYSIEDPEGRKKIPIYRYLKANPFPHFGSGQAVVKLASFNILALKQTKDEARITVEHEVIIHGKGADQKGFKNIVKVHTDELWLKIQNEWYHQFKDSAGLAEAILKSMERRKEEQLPKKSP